MTNFLDLSDASEIRIGNDRILTIISGNQTIWGNEPSLSEILDPSKNYWASGLTMGDIQYTEGLSGIVPTPNGGATVMFKELPDFAHVSIQIGPVEYTIDSINGGIVITTPTGITQYPMPSLAFSIEFGPTSSRKYEDKTLSEEVDLPVDITGIPISFSASPGVRFLAIDEPSVNIPLLVSALR